MSFAAGDRIGSYEIVALLGAGGMGEVFRARDLKLKRDVAIKVLPADVATDQERLARFQREAEVLASLNHAHIAQIFGLEGDSPAEAGRYLVMELVEGEDLSQRIARGAVPIDEALPIARQIAEALEAAHDHGVIHRDLKPANIKLKADGTIKVLDFGLAKVADPVSSSAHQTQSPTITSPAMTMRGVILGTAAYMSPEQAKGRAVDRRADIWAFGCVLYEMLTGQRTFAGEDISDTIVSVLRDDPRWAALPADTPPVVRQLLMRCLQRDPQKRLPHIGVARLELSGDAQSSTGETSPAPSALRPRAVWLVGAALLGAALIAAPSYLLRARAERSDLARVRFSVQPVADGMFPGASGVPRFAVSPDGRRLVYQMHDGKTSQLWLRDVDSLEPRPLPGTDGGAGGNRSQQPFWSPDGKYIGFFDEATDEIKKLDLSNGLIQTVTDITGNQYGASWNDDGNIIYASIGTGGVQMVSSTGGPSRWVTTIDKSRHETAHLYPEFLPDGRHFVYFALVSEGLAGIYVGDTAGAVPKRLFDSSTTARVAWPDRLLFVRNGNLLSQQLDLSSLTLVGDPEPVAENMQATPAGRIGVSASRNGVLAFATGMGGGSDSPFEAQWVDRQGRPVPGVAMINVGGNGVRVSPDGHSLLFSRYAAGRIGEAAQIWVQDIQRGIETRLFSEPTMMGSSAIFNHDGTRVAFRHAEYDRIRVRDLPLMSATGGTQLYDGPNRENVIPLAFTPSGALLMFRGAINAPDRGLWLLPPGAQPKLAIRTGSIRFGAALSPDGKWVAYAEGTDAAATQIFVQSLEDPGAAKYAVSTADAIYPRWNPNGRELFFIQHNRTLMSVAFSTQPRTQFGAPQPLFDIGPSMLAGGPRAANNPFDVSSDGSTFIVVRSKKEALSTMQLVVDVNWMKP